MPSGTATKSSSWQLRTGIPPDPRHSEDHIMDVRRRSYHAMGPVLRIVLSSCFLAGSVVVLSQEQRPHVNPWMHDKLSGLPHVRDVAISPDGSECYITVQSFRKEFAALLRMERESAGWGKPEVASFSGQFIDIEPAFSADGHRLYFASTRPIHPDSSLPKDYDIWYVERDSPGQSWSSPVHLPTPVNTTKNEFYPSLAENGNLYFTREADDPARKEDIFVSRWLGDAYGEPVALSDAVNSDRWEFNAYVAPDESYIIFTSFGRPDDMGGGDLYMSVRSDDGSWLPAQHLGREINSNRIDYCPFVDSESGLLYFTSERSSVRSSYETPQSLDGLLHHFRSGAFGAGRIYTTSFPGGRLPH